jgi:hypothetical protein
MSVNRNAKSYRCVLVIDLHAKNKSKAAEQLISEVEQGWILPEDIAVTRK